FRVKIDNVSWGVLLKISLESGPGAGQDPAARIETWDRTAKKITGKRKGCDVAAGRTSVGVQINFRTLAPDEDSVVRGRILEQVPSRIVRDAPRRQVLPVDD